MQHVFLNRRAAVTIVVLMLLYAIFLLFAGLNTHEGATISRGFSDEIVLPFWAVMLIKIGFFAIAIYCVLFAAWTIYCDLFKKNPVLSITESGIVIRKFLKQKRTISNDQISSIDINTKSYLGIKYSRICFNVGTKKHFLNGASLSIGLDQFGQLLKTHNLPTKTVVKPSP
ncbi:MAG: hypothetical protein HKN36_00725 [Hellea sp.]|nr:hypothetical protein [Hellea sp.]